MIERSDRSARRAVAVSFAIQGATFASIAARLPAIKDDYGFSDFGILTMLAAVAAGSAVGSLVAGLTAARWGSAVTLRIAMAGTSVAAFVAMLGGDKVSFIALATCYGTLVGSVDASQNMQGVGVQERYGRSLMTSFYAIYSLAAALGAGYASLSLALDWSLPTSLAVVAVAGLMANLVWMRSLLPPSADPLEIVTDTPASLPWGPVLLVAVPTFAMWVADSATNVWSGIYLEDGLGAAIEVAPLAILAYQLLLFVVRLFGDRLVGRYGAARLVRVCGWAAVAGLVLIVVAPGVPVVIAGFAVLGAGLSLIPPLAFVAAAHLDPGNADRAVARVNVSNYLGYIVAAFGIAVVAEDVSHRAMFVVPLALVALIPLMARQYTPRLTAAGSAAPAPAGS